MTTFDLPFQWEDEAKQFIAPFVRTKDDELSNVLSALESERLAPGDTFVEAGSGDGRVLFAVAEYFIHKQQKLKQQQQQQDDETTTTATAAVTKADLVLQLVGVELDESLVELATAEATKRFPSSSASSLTSNVSVCFLHRDMRDAQLADASVVFFYLLPGEQLNEIVATMTAHWFEKLRKPGKQDSESEGTAKKAKLRAIVSMAWEVPMLKPFLVGKRGECWHYHCE